MKRFVPQEVLQAYRYLRGAKASRRFLALSGLISVGSALLSLYLISLLFPLVHGIITRDFSLVRGLAVLGSLVSRFHGVFSHPSALFILLVLWVYLVSLAKSGLDYLLSLLVQREALLVAQRTRGAILDRYLCFGKMFFDQSNISALVWQATNCQNWISGLFVVFQSLTSTLLQLTVFLSIMTVVSWQLTIAVLLALPLFQLSRLLVAKIQADSKRYQAALSNLHSRLTQILSFLTLVRTSGKAERERSHFQRLSAEEMAAAFRMHRMTSLMNPVLELTGTTALLFMSLCLSLFVAAGGIDAAKVFVFFFLVMRTIPLLISLAKFRTVVAEQTAAARSFDALMDDQGKHILVSGPRTFSGKFESIDIRRLDFGYVPGRPVLRDLSLCIPQGDMIGLIGSSGVGKTTLANLLFRFYDCPPGTIFIDGVDIRDYDIDSLRSHMALVSQEAAVLEDTVRANLTYSVSHTPSDEELNEVIEKAALTEFVARLPEGLDTVVGERGAKLSGGERQRIAIARAFLKRANILVLDEPTSALDADTERVIAAATRALAEGRTTIVIAHRMSTIRNADMIVVLKDGAVVQEGPPAQLALQPGPFRTYLQAQTPLGPKSSAA